jgi:predicted regulator of Ras-like GTPase activity (Roadblock/LC7/MglB family)
MSSEVYVFALKNTLDEIKNVCPDVSHVFVFKEDGTIVAKDETTDEETVKSTVVAFNALTESANIMGGLESVTFYGADERVNIACIKDLYLTTITSKEADEKYINTLSRVWITTLLRMVEWMRLAPANRDFLTNLEPETARDNNVDEITGDTEVFDKELPVEETVAAEPQPEPIEEELDSEANQEPLLPELSVKQFMVENLGGFLVRSDTVRIDSAVIAEWENLYACEKIEKVDVEALNGKTMRCRVKPIKDQRHEGRGAIQMPENMQLALEIAEGELVMVKAVVE